MMCATLNKRKKKLLAREASLLLSYGGPRPVSEISSKIYETWARLRELGVTPTATTTVIAEAHLLRAIHDS